MTTYSGLLTALWLWVGLVVVAALISNSQNLINHSGEWCHSCCGPKNKVDIESENHELTQVTTDMSKDNTQTQNSDDWKGGG